MVGTIDIKALETSTRDGPWAASTDVSREAIHIASSFRWKKKKKQKTKRKKKLRGLRVHTRLNFAKWLRISGELSIIK